MVTQRDLKEGLIRGAKLFDTLDNAQVAKSAERACSDSSVSAGSTGSGVKFARNDA